MNLDDELTEEQQKLMKELLKERPKDKSEKSETEKIEEIEEMFNNIIECYEKGNITGLLTNLSRLGIEIQPISKDIAPLIPELTSSYGIALKPIIDQLIIELIKGIKFAYTTSTDIYESTIEEHKKYQNAKAKHYANKFNSLISNGFTREESMSILLEEMKNNRTKLSNLPSISFREGKKKKLEKEND